MKDELSSEGETGGVEQREVVRRWEPGEEGLQGGKERRRGEEGQRGGEVNEIGRYDSLLYG